VFTVNGTASRIKSFLVLVVVLVLEVIVLAMVRKRDGRASTLRAFLDPAMTFAFWLEGKIRWRDASCYILAVVVLRCGLLDDHRPKEARLCHFGHHGATD
jgi:glycerol uptake facilitator-like aquaporin